MADVQVSPTSYLGYAFKDQHNLVVLFGAVCFSLSFASAIPLFVGAGGELLWLAIGPRLPAFRDWVDRKLSAQYLARAETAIDEALAQLPELDANRFRALSRNATELVRDAETRVPARQLQLALHGLLELRRTFLDYLFLAQRIAGLLDPTPSAVLEKQVAELRQAYGSERELTARMTIRKRIAALERRMSQQTALGAVSRKLELRLEMLEQALPFLTSRLADPSCEIAPEIDGTLSEIGPAETLELAVDEIFEQSPASSVP
ncbi:MAG TPA: hypothetical protein VGC79_34950 [Polyangiaceae bacterium]